MKYLKIYETVLKNFIKRGTILISGESYGKLYIVVKDASERDKMIEVFYIGSIQMNFNGIIYACIIFNRNDGIIKIFNNKSYRLLTEEETDLLYKSINKSNFLDYINIIKNKTGIDLKDSFSIENYLLRKNLNKYNI